MRTVLFLASVFTVFVASCYVLLERLRLQTGPALGIMLFVVFGSVGLWLYIKYRALPAPEYDRRWDAQVRAHRYQEQERERIAAEMKKQLRAEIRKNPALAHYIGPVENGAIQSMEDLAYRSNPNVLVTCSHLRPIENKLRQAGCTMWLWHAWNHTPIPGTIFASAVLQKFPEPLAYKEEEFYDERSPTYYEARLECPQCNSTIHCVHPNDAGAGTIRWSSL